MDGRTDQGSIRGPRGPKNLGAKNESHLVAILVRVLSAFLCRGLGILLEQHFLDCYLLDLLALYSSCSQVPIASDFVENLFKPWLCSCDALH